MEAMEASIPTALLGDYAQCARLAREHYENFPVASLLLPAAVRPHVAALYAFARTADDFADEPLHEGNRLVELDRWERDFRLALSGRPSHPFCRAFAHSVMAFEIPIEIPLRLLEAFRMDVRIKRWRDWDHLLDYCRHSASPVGRCVLIFSGIREERLHLLSDKICTGLQLINFWQDTAGDLSKGRIYYPKSEWKAHHLSEVKLLKGQDTDETRALVKTAVEKTETLFREGEPLLGEVRGRLGMELKATFGGGLTILRKIRSMNYGVFARRPHLNAWDKLRIASKALAG
jgi:hydroxysqualene synthase